MKDKEITTPSFYPKFTGLERYDVRILTTLLKYHEELITTDIENNKKKVLKEHRVLEKLSNNLAKGHFHFEIEDTTCYLVKKMSYGFKKRDNVGRIYGNGLAMQRISKQLRYLLFGDYYFDVDIKNSAPSFILEYIRKNGLRNHFPCLVLYATKRDALFEMHNELDKDFIKKLLIAHLYVDKPFKNPNIPSSLKNLLNKLVLEANLLQDVMFEDPELAFLKESLIQEGAFKLENMSTNRQAYKASLLSFYCHTQESKVLLDFFEYCQKNNVEQPLPFYDGCYVKKSCVPMKTRDTFLKEFTDTILREKYPCIKMVVSEIKPDFTTINQEHWEKYLDKCDLHTNEWVNFKLKNNVEYQTFLDNSEQLSNEVSELPLSQRICKYKKIRQNQLEAWKV